MFIYELKYVVVSSIDHLVVKMKSIPKKESIRKSTIFSLITILLMLSFASFRTSAQENYVQFFDENPNLTEIQKYVTVYSSFESRYTGYKGYYENFGKYFPYSPERKYDAHNEYVTALANYGILGFIPFMLIFLYPLFYAFKNLKYSGLQKEMAILGIAVIIPFMLNIAFAGTAFYQQVLTSLFYTHTSFIFIKERNGL